MTASRAAPLLPAAAVLPLAAALGIAAALDTRAAVALLAVAAVACVLLLAWRAGLLEPWSLLLVALLSANYNLFLNANAFIAGGTDRGRLITVIASAGLALFALAQEHRRRARAIPFRPGAIDGLVVALVALAGGAFALGYRNGNPQVYLLGDLGQLLQFALAYGAVRLFALVEGPERFRGMLVLLGLSWGLRALAEIVLPGARGTAVIELGGERLFRRTDPLGPMGLPLLAGLALSERGPARAALLIGSCLLVAAQNVLGFTRAHYFALGLALPLFFLLSLAHEEVRSKLARAAPFVGLAAIAAFAFVAPVRSAASEAHARLLDGFDARTHSRLQREAENEAVYDQIREAPLTGHGLGTEYLGVDPLTLRPTVVHFVHDDYLALWLRGGLPLLAVWVAILGCGVISGVRRPFPLRPLVGIGAAAGLLGMAATALVSGSAFGYVAGPVVALLVVVATQRPADERVPAPDETPAERNVRLGWEPRGAT